MKTPLRFLTLAGAGMLALTVTPLAFAEDGSSAASSASSEASVTSSSSSASGTRDPAEVCAMMEGKSRETCMQNALYKNMQITCGAIEKEGKKKACVMKELDMLRRRARSMAPSWSRRAKRQSRLVQGTCEGLSGDDRRACMRNSRQTMDRNPWNESTQPMRTNHTIRSFRDAVNKCDQSRGERLRDCVREAQAANQ